MAMKAAELQVAVCQLTSSDHVDANIDAILEVLNTIRFPEKLDLICLPENALYLRVDEAGPRISLRVTDESIARLSGWVVNHRTSLHIGSVPLLDGDKVYNTSLLLTSDGRVIPVYRKIHLFDVDVIGQKPVRESDVFTRGSETSTFDIKGWKFGSSICYDVRFSELYLRYAREEVDVILVPAAFLTTTGEAHWEVLLRARAIESQAFVLAAAQGGTHRGSGGGIRETHGHSMVVDPWGRIQCEMPEGSNNPGVLLATLKAEQIEAVRRQIPMKNHRTLV